MADNNAKMWDIKLGPESDFNVWRSVLFRFYKKTSLRLEFRASIKNLGSVRFWFLCSFSWVQFSGDWTTHGYTN